MSSQGKICDISKTFADFLVKAENLETFAPGLFLTDRSQTAGGGDPHTLSLCFGSPQVLYPVHSIRCNLLYHVHIQCYFITCSPFILATCFIINSAIIIITFLCHDISFYFMTILFHFRTSRLATIYLLIITSIIFHDYSFSSTMNQCALNSTSGYLKNYSDGNG